MIKDVNESFSTANCRKTSTSTQSKVSKMIFFCYTNKTFLYSFEVERLFKRKYLTFEFIIEVKNIFVGEVECDSKLSESKKKIRRYCIRLK